MTCQENNGQTRSSSVEMALQFRPAHARDFNVEENAAGSRIIRQAVQQLFCKFIGLDRITKRAQDRPVEIRKELSSSTM